MLVQRSLFDKVLNKVKEGTCKDCGEKRKKYTQYCVKCSKARQRQRAKEYDFKIRDDRRCKNKKCNKVLVNPASNSQRYCGEDCRPVKDYSKRIKLLRQEKANREKSENKKDIYRGTIDPKWLKRGTLSSVSKQSDTGGSFIY